MYSVTSDTASNNNNIALYSDSAKLNLVDIYGVVESAFESLYLSLQEYPNTTAGAMVW